MKPSNEVPPIGRASILHPEAWMAARLPVESAIDLDYSRDGQNDVMKNIMEFFSGGKKHNGTLT